MKRLWFITALLITVWLSIAACVSVKQNPPEKRFYALNVVRGGQAAPLPCGPALRIRPFRITPEYSSKGFVYRDAKLRYQSDFYNEFLVNPEPMISTQIEKWLTDAGLFQLVTNAPSKVLPDYFLEGAITSLYGDFQADKEPKAILEIQFFLIQSGPIKADVMLQKRYRQEVPLAEISPDALIEGWNKALMVILTDFEAQLRSAGLCQPLEARLPISPLKELPPPVPPTDLKAPPVVPPISQEKPQTPSVRIPPKQPVLP